MDFYIKQIENKEEWKDFVLEQSYTLFVQSPSYGEFYEEMGEKSWIFGIYDKQDVLIGGSLVVSTHAKRGDFLYLPYGPVFSDSIMKDMDQFNKAIKIFFDFIKVFAAKGSYSFIKASPFLDDKDETKSLFKNSGFRDAPLHALAETTCLLDVSPSEEDLLRGMKKNHRNLVNRCIREGVRVEMKTDRDALGRLNDMHDEVAKRHKFHRFSRKYIEDEFHKFEKHGEAVIFEAYLPDGKLDASAIIMFFGNMANYRHSASLNLNKKLPTSYLIQWEIIKEAKKRGIKWYNFWGVAPADATKDHPFAGITHFKKGFGGVQKDLLHCQDLPLSGMYWANWIIESIRKRKRKF